MSDRHIAVAVVPAQADQQVGFASSPGGRTE